TVLELLGPSTGGIRRHVAALSAGLEATGWHATTAGPRGVLDGLAPLAHEVAVPNPGPALMGARRALRQAVAESGADVVHAHGLRAGWLAVLSRLRRPVVVTVHNLVLDETAGPTARLLRVAEGRLPARVDALVAVSPPIADRFAGRKGAERVRVIQPVGPAPTPARTRDEVRTQLGVGTHQPLVVSLSRLHPQKDLPTLLRAAKRLAERRPDLRVAVAGSGPDKAALHGLAADLDLGKHVSFIPPTDDPAGLLAAADVVAVSSVWEGSPLAVAEALELGRPVVSTPVGFIPKLVVDGESGLLVPVGDSDAFAAALERVLSDPDAAARWGAAGRAKVAQHLNRERLVAEVAAVYDEVVV
ncbi:MAG: glycosyltransferase family 4 protein, partial [Acidimicrobiales bacterium]